MADIVLSAGVRSNLLQLQKTSDLITPTQTKLATGKRVNTALDNPINFFTAQGLSNRASDLSNLLDLDVDRLQHHSGRQQRHHLDHQAGAVRPGAGLARRSRPRTRRSASSLADPVRRDPEPDRHSSPATSGFNGINLLDSNSTDLTVTLNESGTSSVTITAVDLHSATASAINNATNNWAGAADITAASTDLTAALTTLRSQAQAFGSNLSTVQIRQDFTKAMINTLQTGADSLTLADSNEEGANLAGLADPPAAVDHRPVARLAGQPGRAPPVLIIRTEPTNNETAARKCRRFSFARASPADSRAISAFSPSLSDPKGFPNAIINLNRSFSAEPLGIERPVFVYGGVRS